MEEHKTQAGKPEEQVFYDAFRASPIGIAVEDLEGRPLFVNPALCSMLGYSEEEMRDKHCVHFSPREDAEKDWALFQQLRAGMIDHYQLEKRYFQRDGSLVWGRLIISLLKSRPSPLVLAMVEDITDKKAEEARFRHAAVIESSDDAIASATLDGIIVSWNTGAQKIYGYTEAEAVGKPVNMLVPPELPDEENKILEMLRAGGRIQHFETVRVTKTGKRINVALTISPIKDSSGRTVGCSGIARDISERKLAEEALRASEERLRLAQQAARIGTFDWNIRTGVNTWTPELEAMYGLPLGGFGGTQTAFENLVHPDDRAGVIKLVDAAMKSGQPTKGEWRVVWADGSVHWIAGCWQVFMDASGEPSKMIGVNTDVTERKQAEEGLRQKERELSEAQRLAQIGSWEWDPDTDTVNWSRELYRITGRDLNLPAASYKEHSQILTAESWERLQRNVEEALRSGTPYELDLEYVRPDGSTIWARARGEAKRDTAGRIVGLRGTAQDIAERKLAETELSLAHDRLRLAMEAGKSVGWDRDVKSGRDSLFGDLQGMFGIPSEIYDGQVEDFHRYLHAEDRRRVVEAIDYAMETHKPYAAEFRLRWPDGTVRWLAAKGKFYYSQNGEPERMLGVATDITDRKLAEEALRESEERFRLAAEAGRMYTFDWDVVTDVIVRSEESNRIFGLIGEPIRLTKRELLARVHPEDRAAFINSLAECTAQRPNTQISYRLLRPDGSVLWLERTGHAFFDEQGRMVRMIGMVTDVTERKLAENKLQEYERTVEGLEEMIMVVDREYRFLIANNKFLKMRNMTKEQVVGRFVYEVLNKGVFEAVVKEKLDECFQGKIVRYEMKNTYPELGERDILVSYFPIEGPSGVDRVACIVQDITEHKLAEEALSTVSQKLIEAHEEERTHIARELHDDVGQRLVLLAWQLGSSKGDLRKQVEDLANDVQALSHQLHSPKLDYLGLAAAAAGFCGELSDRQRVEIEFHSENIPKELPKEISLCLFRVLQEALQNAIKHSGSRHFQVSLRGGASEIELTVHDSGIGFEPEEAIEGRGLGLTSMQERLKLVQGKLSIDSKPQRGTTIHARVPVIPKTMSAGAVG
jgi:PAS domain S-box-containing protein